MSNVKIRLNFTTNLFTGILITFGIAISGIISQNSAVMATNIDNRITPNLSKTTKKTVAICIFGFCVDTPSLPTQIQNTIEQGASSIILQQFRSFLSNEIPISGTEHKLYPVTYSLFGEAFLPSKLYLNHFKDSHFIQSGDYQIPVHFYCTHVYTFNGSGNRYRLAKINGKMSQALSALYKRASLSEVPVQDIQKLSWSIQTGVSYHKLPESSQILVDQLIPEYRQNMNDSFMTNTINFYDNLSRQFSLPSLDKFLSNLGEIGTLVKALLRAREQVINTRLDYSTLANSFVIQQNLNLMGGIESTPWSQVNEQLSLRLIAPQGAMNDGIIQVRILRTNKQSKKVTSHRLFAMNTDINSFKLLTVNDNSVSSLPTAGELRNIISQLIGIPEANGHQAITASILSPPEIMPRTDRWGALQATKDFKPGTVGYGVYKAIEALYYGNEFLGGYGAFANKYSAEIGAFFQRSDIQELMKQPINSQANLLVAKAEFDYWTFVQNNPRSTAEDKEGARIALKFSPEVRAKLQVYYANGDYTRANLLIIKNYPGIIFH